MEKDYNRIFECYRPIWNALDEMGWSARQDGDTVELENYSPAGEDLIVTLFLDGEETIPKQLYNLYDDFDEEEHVTMWLEAKQSGTRGVPCLWTLVKDAEQITKMYQQLFCIAQEKYPLCREEII